MLYSFARRAFIAFSLFLICDRSCWHSATTPDKHTHTHQTLISSSQSQSVVCRQKVLIPTGRLSLRTTHFLKFNLPVGRWTILTALSVVLTCCPPAPLALFVSIFRSFGFMVNEIWKWHTNRHTLQIHNASLTQHRDDWKTVSSIHCESVPQLAGATQPPSWCWCAFCPASLSWEPSERDVHRPQTSSSCSSEGHWCWPRHDAVHLVVGEEATSIVPIL